MEKSIRGQEENEEEEMRQRNAETAVTWFQINEQ